ncbi:COX15/CtaA family protein [Turneriella parva]|uniref:COX15/CtaA family protein n=1 Tax=Turneriella parva TaxID=29510 RepID=UPI001C25E0F7|nr:COX15/CtaA family protein [Turneriella parva]
MTGSAALRPVTAWLYICAAVVFAIVVIGGITRLTRSGLSIVEWKPVSGVVPPIGETEWQAEFEKYKATPEYRLVNHTMTLPEFKNIFWWEFIHRIFARLVGVIFLLPFLWFLVRKRIDRPLALRLGVIFALGGFQGVLGWYMVKSGLVNDPHVSHLRLTSHLMTAVLIYALMLMTAWSLETRPRVQGSRAFAWANVILVFVMMASGALVAGLKAGKMYNTFPLMNGQYFPQGALGFSPVLSNFSDNPIMVQFLHRNFAYGLGVFFFWQLWRERKNVSLNHPLAWIVMAYLLQFLLGVFTLLKAVPVSLGALHQANALILFTATLFLLARRPHAA